MKMKHQKILNLLNEANYSKFVTRKWSIVDGNSKADYDAANEITYNTEVLKSNLCDYNDAYILVRCGIIVTATPAIQVALKNCAPFTKCMTKIDGTTIDDAEDLDLVMPMYNLVEYSSKYSEAIGRMWFNSKDEATTFNANNANNNFKFFDYKAKLLGQTVAQTNPNHANGTYKMQQLCSIKVFK